MRQEERTVSETSETVAADAIARPGTARELADSLLLFGLTATSLGVYVGIAFAAVRLLGSK